MLLEFDFRGVHSINNTPILTFDFHHSWDRVYPWGPRVRQIKKLHKTKSNQRPILGGSLL